MRGIGYPETSHPSSGLFLCITQLYMEVCKRCIPDKKCGNASAKPLNIQLRHRAEFEEPEGIPMHVYFRSGHYLDRCMFI